VGAFDMSGNVAEWTDHGAVKGGAVGEGDPAARCSHRAKVKEPGSPSIGFRCCADTM
jgi:formylglycine-generating enzyme required for sulfatase activity